MIVGEGSLPFLLPTDYLLQRVSTSLWEEWHKSGSLTSPPGCLWTPNTFKAGWWELGLSRQQSGQGRFEPAPQRPGRALEKECFPSRKEQKQTNRTLTGLKGDYGEKHNLRTVCWVLGAQPAALSTRLPWLP